jgi:trehalose 6-phosphate phosphatase
VNPLHLADLSVEEIGLFLDVDGTLIDIAPRPDAVTVPAALVAALAGAERRLGGALALISGRPVAELDRLFAPLRLRASGVHGSEIRYSADGAITSLVAGGLPERMGPELQRLLERFPGAFAENKGVSFAVHYRGSDVPAEVLADALRRFIDQIKGVDLELTAGLCVFEIRLPGFDKGKAIDCFMARAPFTGRCPVFVADDAMDRAAFDAVLVRGGRAFSVGATLPGLSGCFSGPAAVRAWLAQLAR